MRPTRRWIVPGGVLLALLAAGVLLLACWVDPAIPYLEAHAPGTWILYPNPASTAAHPRVETDTLFRRRFHVDATPAAGVLRLRAFRSSTVTVNGVPVPLPGATSWKRPLQVDIAGWLRPGQNEITVRVLNRDGPPALWLALALPGGSVVSDAHWESSRVGAVWRPAAPATLPPAQHTFDPDRIAERPLLALRDEWRTLAVLVLAAVAGAVGVVRLTAREGPPLAAPVHRWGVGLVALLLVALFVNNGRHVYAVGFDVLDHLAYVEHVRTTWSVPFADQGYQMYQPPLYYAVAAAVLVSTGLTSHDTGGLVALRLVNLALLLTCVLLTARGLARALPGSPHRQVLGLVLAVFLPAQLYLFHYPTNETLVAALGTACLALLLDIGTSGSPSLRQHAWLGAVLGAALLAKVSALLLVPVVLAALLALPGSPGGERLDARLGRTGLVLGVALAVSGWYYALVWARFGSPIVGNWSAAAGFSWWQPPGYRTAWDYLRGSLWLDAPLYGGRHGVWDGFLSTLWGDALCGGAHWLPTRPPWNYALIAAGYVLALVPTLGVLVGAVALARRALWRLEWPCLVLLGAAAVTGWAMVAMSLQVASYAQAKAFYGSISVLPLAAAGALGLDVLAGRTRWRRVAVTAGLLAWGLNAYASHWITGDLGQAVSARFAHPSPATVAQLRTAVQRRPDDLPRRLALAEHMKATGHGAAEIAPLLEAVPGRPDSGRRRYARAVLLQEAGRSEEALLELAHAVDLAPELEPVYRLRFEILQARGQLAHAVEALREYLRIAPFDPDAHRDLARTYLQLGDRREAARHAEYARRMPAS